MKKPIPILFLILVIFVAACAPRATDVPTPLPAIPTALPASDTPAPAVPTPQPATPAPEGEATPASPAPTETVPSNGWQQYTNSDFGFSFQYPPEWFGPDEYVADTTLRLEVGSDMVYPYGTSPEERITNLKNSYYVTIQYTKNNQNDYWKETYQALAGLQDGETFSDQRSMNIKVRDLSLGRFQGIEYITTLSETAQTEPVYIRQVILFDDQSNLLSVMGSPNNVEGGAGWREAYQQVDEANRGFFQQIVESITVE